MPLHFAPFNTEPERKLHYITETGEKEVTLWDLLGIRSGNGQSLSRSPSSSPIQDKVSPPPHLSSYPSGSPYRLSGKLWVPGVPGEEPYLKYTLTMPVNGYAGTIYGQIYKSFMSSLFGADEKIDPPLPPVKVGREVPAIGFRAWTVEIRRKKGKEYASLQGVSHKHPWPGRETMTFRCDKHKVPDAACGCGLYAYHEPNGAPEYMGRSWLSDPYQVMGAVIAWGKVIEYENGFRAQHARPIAIGVPPNPSNDTQAFLNEALAEKAAALLELPCVPYKNLVTYAREFGERLTEAGAK